MSRLYSQFPTLLVVCGPTAVGKTRFAINLAKSLGSIVLSADSRQFYREMSIGTAKPAKDELSEVPHFFVGHLSITDYYNVSLYEQQCLEILRQNFSQYPLIILTGGSGLYIDAVTRGVDEFPDPDPELRKQLKMIQAEKGLSELRKMLKEQDPVYYDTVDLSNPNRILRALEVCISTGRPFSVQRQNQVKQRPFNIIKIGLNLPRVELFRNINTRTELMMDAGLLDEARGLLEFRHLNALNTVGYKELFRYFDNDCTLEQAVEDIKTHTRRYAKRQLTWFLRDTEYQWFLPTAESEVLNMLKGRKILKP